jgi:hypothetical protein
MITRVLCLMLSVATLTGCERAGIFKDNTDV